jgi:hypothetical protein
MAAPPRPTPADHAYAHCLAILRQPSAAEKAAAAAVRVAGASTVAALAAARHEALIEVGRTPPPPLIDPVDLAGLAWMLTGTRPPEERALADLDLRHGLDRAGLGEALGVSPARAAAQATEVEGAWARELDPALLAWLGPGECAELAAVLARNGVTSPRPPVDQLLAVRGEVSAHVATCEECADRERAMVSVRSLYAQTSLEAAPLPVRQAERRTRRRPALPRAARPSRARRAVASAAVAAVALTAALVLLNTRDDSEPAPAAAAEASTLVLGPTELATGISPLSIANGSDRDVTWRATTNVPWIEIVPAAGRLEPGGSSTITVRTLESSPEGDVRGEVTVTASDGSATGAVVSGFVNRPPQVAASADGCRVTATIQDEDAVTSVVLHWPGGQTPMEPADELYEAVLPAGTRSYYVSATDERGELARTFDQRSAC